MKHILKLELKRFFSKKSSVLLMLLSMAMISAFIINESKFQEYPLINDNGQVEKIRGEKAIDLMHDVSKVDGYLTDEKLAGYLMTYRDIAKTYVQGDVKSEIEAIKYANLGGLMEAAFEAKDNKYIPRLDIENLTDEEAQSYYHIREENQKLFFTNKFKDNSVILNSITKLESKAEKPFYVTQFIGWDSAIGSFNLIFILVALLSCFIISPIFTSSYSSGEDEVFKTTANGKKYLGIVKIIASLIETSILFLLSIISYIGTTIYIYGFEGMKTSIQVAIQPILPYPFTLGGLVLYIVVIGFCCLLYLTTFISYISSKTKSILVSSAISISTVILSIFLIGFANLDSMIWKAIIRLLPTGGISIYTDIIEEILFFSIGTFSMGVGSFLFISSIIIGTIFFVLANRSYKMHRLY